MTATSVILLVAGALLLAWGVRQRLGRSEGARAWPGSATHDRAVLVLRPAFGLVMVVVGLLPLVEGAPAVHLALGAVALLALLVGLGWGILPLPMPRWSLPGWYVARTGRRPGRAGRAKPVRRG